MGSKARLFLPLGLAVCLSLFGDLTLYAVLAAERDVVGLSLGAVGVMLGANRLIRIPGNLLAGVLFDRWGRRPLFLLGMAIGTVSVAGFGLVQGFWPFLLTRLGWGIAWTLINVGGMTMVLDVSVPADRARLVGLYNVWMWLGLALGPLVGGFLVDGLGFRVAMLICASLGALGFLIVLFTLPETQRPSGQGEGGPVGDKDSPRVVWHKRVLGIFRAAPALLTVYLLYLITHLAGDGVALSTVSLLLERRFGSTVTFRSLSLGVASVSGLLLGMRSLLAGAVGPLAGRLADARQERWPVITASLILGILGFGLLAWEDSLGLIVLGVALSAVSGGTALSALAAQVGDYTPRGKEGVAMGAYATAGDIGSTSGPFLAYALVAVMDLRWVYVLCSLTFVVGLVLSWYRPRGEVSDSVGEASAQAS